MEQPKIERVLRLMKMMTGNNNYTVEDMAERLGISYRSVYRYIETFKDSGFVVQRKDGGIYKLGKESYTDNADSDFRFVCAVIETAMILHKSEHAKNITIADVDAMLGNLDLSKDTYKSEFHVLIRRLVNAK